MTSAASAARERRRARLHRIRLRVAGGAAGLVLTSTGLVAAAGHTPSSAHTTGPASAGAGTSSTPASKSASSEDDWGDDGAAVNSVSSGAS